MSKILMLDLEGVLIATGSKSPTPLYGIRPHSQHFICEIQKHFDIIYMNTTVTKSRTIEIMKNIYNFDNFKYRTILENTPYGKAEGYEIFSNDTLIHLEDEPLNSCEAQRIIELGHTYISIPSWSIQKAYVEKNNFDTELLKTLDKIKKLL